MEPIVQKGHEGLVHHILVYECSYDFPTAFLNHSGHCYDRSTPQAIMRCAGQSTVAAWAIGGGVSSVYHQKRHIHHLHYYHNHHLRYHHHHYHHHGHHHHYHHNHRHCFRLLHRHYHHHHHHHHHHHVYHHLCLKQLEVCLSISGKVLKFVASNFISTQHMRKKGKSGHCLHH